jgi:hypothetical protein
MSPVNGPDESLERLFGVRMNPLLVALLLFLLLPSSAAAQEIGRLTLRDGALRVIRGSWVLQGVEGMRLRQGDILESSQGGFAQLEFNGGAITALGPSSRLFLFSQPAGGEAKLILLSGWLKGETGSARSYRYLSSLLAATTKGAVVVLHVEADGAEIFVESGSATVGEVSPAGNLGRTTMAKSGQFFSRRSGKSVTTNSRPDSAFLGSMPVPFRDTLPSRMSRFSGAPPEPKRDHEVSYSEVESWLKIAPTWREGFVERLRPRLKDSAFRRGLEDHLSAFPEWDPILHPEKQKTAPPDKPGSAPGRYPQ